LDTATGKELKKLEGHTEPVFSATFSPDGKMIVTASGDNTARIWDATTGKELKKLEGHTSWINSAVFSPDGKTVVTASNDDTARIWKLQDDSL
jgi:WD40 repeat protein